MEEKKLSLIHDVVRILKGPMSGALWICLFIVSLAAIYCSLWVEYNKKGKANPLTPPKFSFAYLSFNNFWRITVGIIVMWFFFRLTAIIVSPEWLKNEDMMLLFGAAVGFLLSLGVDNALRILQERANILKTPNPYADVKKEILEKTSDTASKTTE